MSKPFLTKIPKGTQKHFSEALYFLNMAELKSICSKLQLDPKGKKGERIQRIQKYLSQGKITKPKIIPKRSIALKGFRYPLHPKTLILLGSYKNDLKTRTFMKSLIGEHFHFTAFGQDWMKARWEKGNPPTYAEFAHFWQKEYLKRKRQKARPKQEWAYLSFTQQYLAKHPAASRTAISNAWEKVRKEKVAYVKKLLKKTSSR